MIPCEDAELQEIKLADPEAKITDQDDVSTLYEGNKHICMEVLL